MPRFDHASFKSPLSMAVNDFKTASPAVATSFNEFNHEFKSVFKTSFSQSVLNVSTAVCILANSSISLCVFSSSEIGLPFFIFSVMASRESFMYSDSGNPAGTLPDPGQLATFLAIVK